MTVRVDVNIEAIAKKAKRRVETAAHEVTQDLAETVVLRTPVQTGILRGSWFASINDPEGRFLGEPDRGGQQTLGRITAIISQANVGTDIIYILNNANYAPAVEFGTQFMSARHVPIGNNAVRLPGGMVRTTVNDAPQIAQDTLRRIQRL